MEITDELIATIKERCRWNDPSKFVHLDYDVLGACPNGIYRFIRKGDYRRNKYNEKLQPDNLFHGIWGQIHVQVYDDPEASKLANKIYNILVSEMSHETVTINDFDFPVLTEEVITDIIALLPSNLVYTDYIQYTRWHLVNEETGLIKREDSTKLVNTILCDYLKHRCWSIDAYGTIDGIIEHKYKTNKNLTDSDFEL